MTTYVNAFYLPDRSIITDKTQVVTVDDLDDTVANTITSATRYDMNDPAVAGVDLSSKVTISGQDVTIADFFTSTRVVGTYRLKVVVSAPTPPPKVELNVIVTYI